METPMFRWKLVDSFKDFIGFRSLYFFFVGTPLVSILMDRLSPDTSSVAGVELSLVILYFSSVFYFLGMAIHLTFRPAILPKTNLDLLGDWSDEIRKYFAASEAIDKLVAADEEKIKKIAAKAALNSGAKNISPEEIERAVLKLLKPNNGNGIIGRFSFLLDENELRKVETSPKVAIMTAFALYSVSGFLLLINALRGFWIVFKSIT